MNFNKDNIKIIEQKIKSIEEIISVKSILSSEGKLVAFTNGCFDILHRGHIEYLAKAAQSADYLIVGVNSDNSVKRQNKSPERPINNQETRCIN
ncbi:MAG: adenylyltransferase/cytidyltransferase family protein, partial [Bacteroidota bacterium]